MPTEIRPHHIASGLRHPAGNIRVEVVDETVSTNSDLLDRIATLSGPVMLLAKKQTGGRGRNGRAWHSEPGASLTFSLAWPFSRQPADLSGLSLAVGVSLAQTLRKLGVHVSLKWPNDVLKNGKKLAGILAEIPPLSRQPEAGGHWAVIGIGINLLLPDELESRIGQPAADALWLSQMDRNLLISFLLNDLADTLLQYDRDGLQAFTAPWNELHLYAGKRVALFANGQGEHVGTVAGIDEQGRLVLENHGGRMAFSAGEVSLRHSDE